MDDAAPAVSRPCTLLVGREEESTLIDTMLADAVASRGRLVAFVGEGGIGKSRLAHEAIRRAGDRGLTVLTGRATRLGSRVPLKPLAEALAGVDRERADVADHVDEWLAGLSQLATANPPRRLPFPMLDTAATVVRGAAGRTGALLALEDIHWADPETLAVVEYLAGALVDTNVATLVTVRDDEPSEALRMARDLSQRDTAIVRKLRRLGDDAVARMVAAMTGLGEPSDEITRAVIDRSEGVPFVVEELTAAAIEEGMASARTVVPAAIRARVGERVRGLPREAQEVLSAAAVVGPATVDVLTAVVHTSVDRAAAALAAAREQLLVSTPVADAAYAFPHVLVRDALVDLLGEHHHRELARSAAATLESSGARERAAALWEVAGDPARAARALIDVGRRRFAHHGVADAIAALERAAALADGCGDHDSATLAREELCDIVCFAGLADRAAALSGDVLARARNHGGLDTVAAAHLRCARAALVAADDERAEAHLRSARAFSTGGDVALAVSLDVVAAAIRTRRGGSVNRWRAIVHAAEASYRREVLFDALLAAAGASIHGDLDRARRLLEQALDVATAEGCKARRARALVELALVDHRGAVGVRALRDAHDLAEGAGLVGDVVRLDVATTWVHLARGDHAAAAVAIDGARARCERDGLGPGLRRDVLVASGQLAAQTADRRRFEAVCSELVDDRPGCHAARRATEAMWILVRDGAAAAHDHLGDARDLPLDTGVFAESLSGLWCLVHELVEGGSGRDDPWRPRRATSWTAGYHVLADAVRAGRAGDRDGADRLAANAWEHFRSTPWNLNVARLLVADDAAAHGWGAAEQWLREALGTFDTHDHGALASLCRAAIRGIGAPVPRRGRGDHEVPPSLRAAGVTSREMDVLALVGQGLSNRAIARRLVLGERTVKSHVTSLLRKVGASTRDELRRRTSPLLVDESGIGATVG